MYIRKNMCAVLWILASRCPSIAGYLQKQCFPPLASLAVSQMSQAYKSTHKHTIHNAALWIIT